MTRHSEEHPTNLPARNWRAISMTIAALAIGIFAAANAHLVFVAFASQPDCVAHDKTGAVGAGSFGAAKSSC